MRNVTSTPGLVYRAVSYHHPNARGLKSPAPQNPQITLNNSILYKTGNNTRRVGVDTKASEFVVFDYTNDGTWHGHVRKWSELRPEMQQALIKARKVTKKGKIIG